MVNDCNNGWGWTIYNTKSLKGHEARLGKRHCDLKEANEAFDKYAKYYKIELMDNRTTKIIRKN